MNLKKYTKAELISQIKKSKSELNNKANNNNTIFISVKNYLFKVWDSIAVLKNILLKITLISLIIQIFKKYRLFRKLWLTLNTIVMSIFSISLLDNFGFDFISNFLTEVKFILGNTVDYLTNTHFYKYLTNIFSNKPKITTSKETDTNEISVLRTDKTNATGNSNEIRESNRNSKISEWLKPESESEIIENKVEENSYSNYKKYLIVSGIIVATCLTWYYKDEILENLISTWEWLSSFRSGGSGDQGGNGRIEPTNNTTNIPRDGGLEAPRSSARERLDKLVKEKLKSSNNVTFSNAEIDTYFKDPEKLKEEIETAVEMVDKGKSAILTSPSLEDLNKTATDSWGESSGNKSPESVTSDETIKASTSKLPPLTSIEKIVDQNWKEMIDKETKDSVKYVESHFPKSDIEDSSYVKKLINEIRENNIKIAQELKNRINNESLSRIRTQNAIIQKTDLWVEEMLKK